MDQRLHRRRDRYRVLPGYSVDVGPLRGVQKAGGNQGIGGS
jgi:hypothetical protein